MARRLGLAPDADVLGGLVVPRFADEPLATPQRPNEAAWSHVTDRQLAELVTQSKARLAAATTDPCRWCGSTVREEEFGRSDEGMCGQCVARLCRRFQMPDGRRDYAAAILMGMTDHGGGPPGLGREVGLRWWSELPERDRLGARSPFAWLRRSTVEAWCEQRGGSTERVFRIPW